MKHLVLLSLLAVLASLPACHKSGSSGSADTDTGTDTDTDADTDTDTGTATDTDSGTETDTASCGTEVWEGDYEITDQADIDQLDGITRIDGWLQIVDTSLPGLDGLEALVCVDGQLAIGGNPALSNINGLASLEHLGGLSLGACNAFGCYENPVLENLLGLQSLKTVESSLSIVVCSSLVNLSGLEGVQEVGGSVRIGGNDALVSLDGLDNLEYIQGYLYIGRYLGMGDNLSLESIEALAGLFEIGGGLHIRHNDVLESLSGLQDVDSIGGALLIDNNPLLSDVSSLLGLEDFDGIELSVTQNDNLPTCDAIALRDHLLGLSWTGAVCITGNLPDACENDTSGC